MKRNHRSLRVWQEAIELVVSVYSYTRTFPNAENFGLTAQMRRAAVSVPANIAEGFARSGTRDLLHYLNIAPASLSELDTHIEIANRVGYLKNPQELNDSVNNVSRLLAALVASLKRRL